MKKTIKNRLIMNAKSVVLSTSMLIVGTIGANAQTGGSLRMDARQGQGYLYMDQPSANAYSCWRYVFSERTGIASVKHPNGIIPLDNITVCGKDYIQVPVAYGKDKNRDIIVSVYGSTRAGETLVLSNVRIGNYTGSALTVENPDQWVARCGAGCDGNNYNQQSYAFQFVIYEKVTAAQPNGTGAAHLRVEESTQETFNGSPLPFYGYYTRTQANHWLQMKGSPIVDVDVYLAQSANNFGISPRLNLSHLSPNVHIYGPDGNIITEDHFYMIPKDMGPFYASNLQTIENYTGWETMCASGTSAVNTYINQMNAHIQSLSSIPANWIPLSCVGNGFSLQEGGEAPEAGCGDLGISFLNDENGPWEYLQAIAGCGDNKHGAAGDDGEWHQIATWVDINIFGWGTFHNVFHWDLGQGQPTTGTKTNFPAGLYEFRVAMKDGSFKRVVVEVKETFTDVTNMADLVSELVFPVPIVNDKYSISIETPLDANITYQLLDKNGNQIYSLGMKVAKNVGRPTTIPINPGFVLPTGNLFHRFTYTDGSSETIQTVK